MDIEIVYQIILALAGLGVLLYGIKVMNSSTEKILGYKFKSALNKCSKNAFKSYGLGAGATVAVQTSVLTITMIVGLINMGAIGLSQSIALVIGANFGSALAMILLAFQSVSLLKIFSVFALVGMVILIFAKNSKSEDVGKTILGFGLLCLGITLLSSNMQELTTGMKDLLSAMTNPLLLLLFGVILTVIMQSAYPVLAILIAFVTTGLMTFESSIYVILGANVGATLTTLFVTSFGDGYHGKRVVIFNLLYKVFTAILFCLLLLIPNWASWIHNTLCGGVASISLIVVMLLCNFIPGIFMLCFTGSLAKLMTKIVRKREKETSNDYNSFEIDEQIINNPMIANQAVKNNITKILKMEIEQNELLRNTLLDKDKVYVSQKGKLRALEKAIKLTTNNAIRISNKYDGDDLDRINVVLNILNSTSQILKVNSRLDEYTKQYIENTKLLNNEQLDFIQKIGKDTNDLGNKVYTLLTKDNSRSYVDDLRVVFEINDINIGNNNKAKQGLLQTQNRKKDNSLYFNILYELGKLETDYTDIAIKITLLEE